MAQEKIKINGAEIFQPDEGLGYDFETTYTEDTTRVQSGRLHSSPMFTVESLSYEASDIPLDEASKILQMVAKGKNFQLRYYSCYYGQWRTGAFYVGKGSMSIGTLKADEETLESLSFNMIGVDPI